MTQNNRLFEDTNQQPIHQSYDVWAETYDSDNNLTRDLAGEVLRRTLQPLRVNHTLEIGCGTGRNTAFLAERSGQVTAVDFSPGMLAQARQNVSADKVAFQTADITQPWPQPDASIDLIVCALVLEHIANLSPVFAAASRVLAPGGRFFIVEYHPFKQYQGKQAKFSSGDDEILIPAYLHHVGEFFREAADRGLTLTDLGEWWHEQDEGKPPRIISLLFQKSGNW